VVLPYEGVLDVFRCGGLAVVDHVGLAEVLQRVEFTLYLSARHRIPVIHYTTCV